MTNFFDQFDPGVEVAPSGRLRITVTPPSAGGGEYAGAISKIESGGNYRAIGPATRDGDRAVGKYQIMGKNIGPWTEEVLGRRMNPLEFAASPEAQDAVFKSKFGSYVDKYGPEGAARAWFAGERGMNDPNRRDTLGTTVADYGRRFMSNLGPTEANAVEAKPGSGPNFFDQFDEKPKTIAQTPEPAKKPDPTTSTFGATMRGAAQGISFGFGDEITAIEKAAGTPGFPGHVIALYKKLSGDPEFSRKYDEYLEQERQKNAKAEDEHKAAYITGNVLGSLAVPMGAIGGATLPARMGSAAKFGAVVGGLSGAGDGTTLEDRATRAAVGTGLGAVAGAAGVPIVEGAGHLIGAAVRKPVDMVRAAVNPTGAAERAVGRAYIDAVRADPTAANRLTAGEVANSGPAVVMDALGQPGRNLARSAANISGAARDTLNQTLDPRLEGQVPRIVNWLRSGLNFGDVHATQTAIDTLARGVNRAAYGRAMGSPQSQSVWDGTLQQVAQAPVVQEAIRNATRTSANRAAAEGAGVVRNPFTFDANGVMGMQPGVTPNLRFWDAVKRNLDDTIEKLQRAGEISAARDAQELRAQMVNHLDRLVPDYRRARSGAAAFFNAENALEAGQNYVTQNFANAETRRILSQMTPTERGLFQDGFISRLAESLETVPDRADLVRRIYNSPAAREKIQITLGSARAQELEAMLRVEGIMQQSLRGVQGNSTTVQQLLTAGAAGAAGGAGGGGYLGFDPTTSGAIAAALTMGKKGIDARVAMRVAEMLTSNDPTVLRRGVQMLARSNQMMNALRTADTAAVRAGGGQIIAIPSPAGQLPAASRADDKPEIPRPVGQ